MNNAAQSFCVQWRLHCATYRAKYIMSCCHVILDMNLITKPVTTCPFHRPKQRSQFPYSAVNPRFLLRSVNKVMKIISQILDLNPIKKGGIDPKSADECCDSWWARLTHSMQDFVCGKLACWWKMDMCRTESQSWEIESCRGCLEL